MTKADLVNEVHKENGLPKREASDVVELILDTLKKLSLKVRLLR